MAGEQIDHGRGDGVICGRSDGKVGFYGTTPITKPFITVVGTTTATTALNETKIARLTAALEALGLIATTT